MLVSWVQENETEGGYMGVDAVKVKTRVVFMPGRCVFVGYLGISDGFCLSLHILADYPSSPQCCGRRQQVPYSDKDRVYHPWDLNHLLPLAQENTKVQGSEHHIHSFYRLSTPGDQRVIIPLGKPAVGLKLLRRESHQFREAHTAHGMGWGWHFLQS